MCICMKKGKTLCVYTYIYIYMTYVHAYIRTCTHTYPHTCKPTNKHTHVYAYIHKVLCVWFCREKRMRFDSAVQSKAFREIFIWNANVSERQNRFALFSAGHSNAKHYIYTHNTQMHIYIHTRIQLAGVTVLELKCDKIPRKLYQRGLDAVGMYACIYACIYVCMYARMYVRMYV
jgi:hypothetical protein